MKKTFYIFLDIDGVLYDWDYIINEVNSGRMKRGSCFKKFKPESIKALNYLIKMLGLQYDVKLVISSTWRSDLSGTIQTLKKNGLEYNNLIERTPFIEPSKRGEEILWFLKDKENYKFVIIDDEQFDFSIYFKKSSIIKTEMFHDALSVLHVRKFLDNYNYNQK